MGGWGIFDVVAYGWKGALQGLGSDVTTSLALGLIAISVWLLAKALGFVLWRFSRLVGVRQDQSRLRRYTANVGNVGFQKLDRIALALKARPNAEPRDPL